MENAIERVLGHKAVVEKYGDRLPAIKEKLLGAHKLDCLTDQPIPDWAIQILKDPTVGYRTRIRIVMTHQFDITGESPSWRFVTPKDMREAPERPAPKELKEFRKAKAAEAAALIKKLNDKEGV